MISKKYYSKANRYRNKLKTDVLIYDMFYKFIYSYMYLFNF